MCNLGVWINMTPANKHKWLSLTRMDPYYRVIPAVWLSGPVPARNWGNEGPAVTILRLTQDHSPPPCPRRGFKWGHYGAGGSSCSYTERLWRSSTLIWGFKKMEINGKGAGKCIKANGEFSSDHLVPLRGVTLKWPPSFEAPVPSQWGRRSPPSSHIGCF